MLATRLFSGAVKSVNIQEDEPATVKYESTDL